MADDQTSRQASTVEHIKNPGRVAWGKKLARMSRESKAEKKASTARRRRTRSVPNQASDEKIEQLIQKDIKIDSETKSMLNLHRIEVIVGIAAGIGGLIALYLNYKSNKSVLPNPSVIGPSKIGPGGIGPPQTNPTVVEQYDPRNF
jgi:hypothetical protein